MTFGEARDKVRLDVLAEASTDYYTDVDLLDFVKDAAREVAQDFGFPVAVSSVVVTAGDGQFALPADSANVNLDEVAFDGFRLALQPYAFVASVQEQVSIGQPRYYNFDPKRGGVVFFAPQASRNGTISFEYNVKYDPSAAAEGDQVWDGLFPPFHNLVVYLAGSKAFDASLETERAAYWLQRYNARAQEFGAFLNKTPLNEMVAQEVARS